jgi:hypothetical protein
MRNPDNIDLLYILGPHGWGACLLYLDGSVHETSISYVFSDPAYDCMEAIILLLKGLPEAEFTWWGEPGGWRWKIARNPKQHHMINIVITEFSDSYAGTSHDSNGASISDEEILVEFEIKIRHFATLVYCQMKKISILLGDRSFDKSRSGNFPHSQFAKLEALLQASRS